MVTINQLVYTLNHMLSKPETKSKIFEWLPKLPIRVPRSSSFHAPDEIRSSDENLQLQVNIYYIL